MRFVIAFVGNNCNQAMASIGPCTLHMVALPWYRLEGRRSSLASTDGMEVHAKRQIWRGIGWIRFDLLFHSKYLSWIYCVYLPTVMNFVKHKQNMQFIVFTSSQT